MEHLFAIYLVLAEKQRFDESNLVDTYDSSEVCEYVSKGLNDNYELMWPDKNHNLLYVCKPYDKEKI